MILPISLLVTLLAAPAPAQNNPFGPSQGQLDQARKDMDWATRSGPTSGPKDDPRYTQLLNEQESARKRLVDKQKAEYQKALNDPGFTSNERAAALKKADIVTKMKMATDVPAVMKERQKAFEQLTARHEKERADLVRKQGEDRQNLELQIVWSNIGKRF
jgi:hypothetical protein